MERNEMSPSLKPTVEWCRDTHRKALRNQLGVHWLCGLQIALVVFLGAALFQEIFRAGNIFRLGVFGSLILIAIFLLYHSLRYRRRLRNLIAFAASIERRTPAFRSSLVTSVELTENSTMSEELPEWVVDGLQSQVQAGVDQTDLDDLVGRSVWRKAFLVFGCTLLGIAAASYAHKEVVRQAVAGLLKKPLSMETKARTNLVVASLVNNLEVELSPPAYSGRSNRQIPGFSGTIRALPGTEITLKGAVAVDGLTTLRVYLPDTEEKPEPTMLRLRDGTFEFRHIVSIAGDFHFEGLRTTQRVQQARPYTLETEEDEPPRIRILFPSRDQEVHLGDEVKIMFEGRDDFGLARVRRIARIEGAGIEQVRPVGMPDGRTFFSGGDNIMFSDLGARPGDVVEILYEAEDTDTVRGPKLSRSAPRRFKIFSAEERHANILAKESALLEAMLIRLADRLEFDGTPNTPTEASLGYSSYLRILSLENVYLRTFDTLVQLIADDPHTSELVRRSLEEMLDRQRTLHERDASRANSLNTGDLHNPIKVAETFQLNTTRIDAYETDALTLDELIIQQRQDRLAADAEALQNMEEKLRALLSSMKEKATDSQTRQALDMLDRLRQRVQRMRNEMNKLAQKMPDEHFNPDALLKSKRNTGLNEIDQKLQKIRELIQQGKMKEALKLAEELEREIQQLNEQMREGLLRPRTGSDAKMGRQLKREMRELDRLARDQGKVLKDTKKLEEVQKRTLEKFFRKGFEEQLEKAKKKVRNIKQRMNRISEDALHPYDRDALKRHRNDLDRLEKRLESRDIPNAAKRAKKLANEVDRTSMEIKLSARKNKKSRTKRKMREASGQCKEAGARLGGLSEDLEALLPNPREALGERGMRRSRELQERQKSLEQRLQKTSKKIQKASEGAPALKQVLKGLMEGAGEFMKRSSDRLGQGEPKLSNPHQKDALERLKNSRDQIKQALKPNSGSGAQMTGTEHNRERVDIPGQDAYKPPRIFRELLMRTMKEPIPPRYKETMDRYFRELSR
jgi:hypothetical protein